jgi:hypothetical protein
MATSGITSWPLTAEEVVSQALFEIGAYAAGETPSGTDMEDGVLRLNAMLKTWQGEGNLFREAATEVTFPAGAGELALDEQTETAGIRAVSNAWVVGSYNRLLAEWNRSEYLRLPNPGQTGQPTIWYAETTNAGVTLHLWPVPSTDTLIALDYQLKAQTVTDPSETVDVPEEWQECLILGLASRLASMFGTTRIDPATVQRVDQRASALYDRLMDRDRPDSYTFETDC